MVKRTTLASSDGERVVEAAARIGVAKEKTPEEVVDAIQEEMQEMIRKTVKMAPPSSPMDNYYISPETRLVFNTAVGMSKARPGRAVKVMMIGPLVTARQPCPGCWHSVQVRPSSV